MIDFTSSIYKSFLESLVLNDYSFFTFEEFLEPFSQAINYSNILLRHDVDKFPNNSLRTAEIESSLGIKGSYYFRIVPESFDEEVMIKISNLGHEIGYHYEEMDTIYRKYRKWNRLKILQTGNKENPENGTIGKRKKNIKEEDLVDEAYELFCQNLEKMRKLYPIKTICAHGSPLSPFDNKLIWKKYNYKDHGIYGEPSLDIDWNDFAYFTDTGRCWNGNNVSVRDKVDSKFKFNYRTTQEIINNIHLLPGKIMFTIHPQRWNDNIWAWEKELIAQSGKNFIKKYFYVNNGFKIPDFLISKSIYRTLRMSAADHIQENEPEIMDLSYLTEEEELQTLEAIQKREKK